MSRPYPGRSAWPKSPASMPWCSRFPHGSPAPRLAIGAEAGADGAGVWGRVFGQLLGRGLNPAWWPYYLWSVSAWTCIDARRPYPGPFRAMLGAAVLRGLLAYSYMYLLLAPFLWQQFDAWWYVGLKISLGVVGCTIGAWLAWRFARPSREPRGTPLRSHGGFPSRRPSPPGGDVAARADLGAVDVAEHLGPTSRGRTAESTGSE